jgi:hypothetical protein
MKYLYLPLPIFDTKNSFENSHFLGRLQWNAITSHTSVPFKPVGSAGESASMAVRARFNETVA